MTLRIADFTGDVVVDPPFGLSAKRAAVALRKLADDLDAGRVLLGTPVTIMARAEREDFSTQELTLRLHEKREA